LKEQKFLKVKSTLEKFESKLNKELEMQQRYCGRDSISNKQSERKLHMSTETTLKNLKAMVRHHSRGNARLLKPSNLTEESIDLKKDVYTSQQPNYRGEKCSFLGPEMPNPYNNATI